MSGLSAILFGFFALLLLMGAAGLFLMREINEAED